MTLSKDHHLNLKNGCFDGTTKADLERLFQTLAADPNRDRLVLYFHGGLVTQKAALAAAETALLPAYRAAGAYPVFFIWQSGLLETLSNNLAEIFDEKIYQHILERVAQFVEAKLKQTAGERGGRLELSDEFDIRDELRRPQTGDEPFAWLDDVALLPDDTLTEAEEEQLREILEADDVLLEEAEAIANALRTPDEIRADVASRGGRVQGSRHTLMSPEVLDEIRQEAPSPEERGIITSSRIIKGAAMVCLRVIRRLAQKRDHGIYSTIVEEILREFYVANAGKLVWDLMKGDTADAFGADPAQHGGTAFIAGLKKHWEAGQRPRITLIGHSTGAIYICHLLAHAAQHLPPEMKFEVIFLAPACDFGLFAKTLQDHGDRIAAFRLFGMQNTLEAKDRLVPVVPVYPRSLLYFVSGVVEAAVDMPLVGMERYYSGRAPYDAGAFPEVDRVRGYAEASPARLVWSEAQNGPGCASSAKKHGDFDDEDDATLKSVQHIIAEGFDNGN